jgi:type II secretory pathway pseudopilin PulG
MYMNTFLYSYSKMVKARTNAFTILELLVVIGLIIILAITLLTLLNPAEAQKRNRDAKRLRDVTTLQTIVSQYLEDGNSFGSNCTTTTPCSSLSAGNVDSTPPSGATNWLGGTSVNLSIYTQTIPVDPVNGTSTCVTGVGTTASCSIVYRVAVSGREYEINMRMESTADEKRVVGDGGDSTQWFEVYNGSNSLMTN